MVVGERVDLVGQVIGSTTSPIPVLLGALVRVLGEFVKLRGRPSPHSCSVVGAGVAQVHTLVVW